MAEKIAYTLNIYEKDPNVKSKPSFKKRCIYCRRYGHNIAECRQNQHDNLNRPQKHRKPNKSFHQNSNSSEKPLSDSYSNNRSQSPNRKKNEKSDTENTLINNMLKVENIFETPTESK